MRAVGRPSASWYGGAAVLALVGLLGAVAWGVGSYMQLQDRLEDLPRTAVPGAFEVQVEQGEGVVVYYEDPVAHDVGVRATGTTTLSDAPVALAVTGPDGSPIATSPYATDLRFDVDGRVAVALATFDAPSSGTVTVAVTGEVPPAARVSAGDVVDAGLLANAAGAVAVFVGTIVATLVMVVVIAVRRARTPSGADAPRERTLTPA